jgi:hypothetical protein
MLGREMTSFGRTAVKQRIFGAMLAMFAFVAPAAAQGYEPGTLPPQEVVGIVRSGGFDPLGQPVRRGPNYVMRAVDDYDREVRVVINARSGDILSVTPVATASRVPPGGSMGPYQRMAPGYVPPPGPQGVARGNPPMIYEDDEPVYRRPPAPVPNAPLGYLARPQAPGAAPPNTMARPAPGAAPPADADDDEASAPADSRPIRSTELPPPAGQQDGLLPPPPERFPQRAQPAAPPKPKPVKRAAATPPKAAPLPKPRPSSADAPPPPMHSTPIPPPAPEPPPAADETPH